MPGCLILDDDELQVPFVKSPIDEYRGTGKKVVRASYIKSSECKFRCIPHQIGKGNTCMCNDKHDKLTKRLAEVRLLMDAYNGNQYVNFGKFATCKWQNMCRDKDRLSWTEWYLKNSTKRDLFYEYLVLLSEEDELLKSIRDIENPYYD
jgi:hypothetical protein